MRILKVIHDFLPVHAAGSELYCYYLSRELARRHQVHLFFTEVDLGRAQYDWRRSSFEGIPCYEVVHNHVYRRFEDTYADPEMERVFGGVLDEVRPDVVHLHHLMNHSINYIALAKQRGIPVVFTLHDYWLSCHNVTRMRHDSGICDTIEPRQCVACARRLAVSRASTLLWRAAARLVGLRRGWGGDSLLQRLELARSDAARPLRSEDVSLGGEARAALRVGAPSQVQFELEVPAGTRLRFGVGEEFRTGSEAQLAFEVRANDQLLWRHVPSTMGPRWVDAEVLLPSARAGGRLRLQLVTRPLASANASAAGWSGLRLVGPPRPGRRRLAPARALGRALVGFLHGELAARRHARVEERLRRVRQAVKQADLFIAPSRFLASRMIEFGLPADRVVLSDYGVATSLFRSFERRPSELFRFGYVGALSPHKGVHLLLEAFALLLRETLPQAVRLQIHGNARWFPRYVGRLRRLARGLPVEFRGAFEHRRVAEVYAQIDVLVVPSLWWENAPLTIHEAAASRTPVITADFGGMADFVRDGAGGWLFRRGDARDLARQMRRSMDEPERLARAGRPGFPVTDIRQDAAEMERRYLGLLDAERVRPAVSS